MNRSFKKRELEVRITSFKACNCFPGRSGTAFCWHRDADTQNVHSQDRAGETQKRNRRQTPAVAFLICGNHFCFFEKTGSLLSGIHNGFEFFRY